MHQGTGGDEAACDRLLTQLRSYLAQQNPFGVPFLSTAKGWWQSVELQHREFADLVSLAVCLCDFAPHAASEARVLSIMGWYHTPVRSSLSTDTVAMMVALKAHLQLNVPRY